MSKTKSFFLLVLLAISSLTANLSAQLNESFNYITYGVPNGWDNSDYDNVNLSAWSYNATGFDGSGVACKAIDVSQRSYAILKTPMLSSLPAGCQLTFMYNAPANLGEMSVYLTYGAKRIDLGRLRSREWTEFSYDLSDYAGYSVQICFRLDCGGRGSNAQEWYYLDNVKVAPKPNCAKPQNLVINSVNQTSVNFSWSLSDVGSKAEEFDIVVKNVRSGEEVFNQTVEAADYTYIIDNLTAATDYELSIVSNCSDFGQGLSDRITTKFSTLCANQILPYSHSFDGWTTLPDCWLGSSSGISVQEAIKIGRSAVRIASTSSKDAYIISPQMAQAANNMEIGFSVYGAQGTKYSIFLTPDPTDMSQAVPLWENVEIQKNNEWQTLTYNTIQAPFADKGMAVVIFMPAGIDAVMYVDNFVVNKAPTCPKLENLVEVVSDSTFTTLDWSEFITSNLYQVMMTKDSVVKSVVTGQLDSTISVSRLHSVDSHPCTIYGLDKNTKYSAKVRSICSENDTSAWSSSITIHTSCGIRAESVFFEGFESGVFPPECWFVRQTYKAADAMVYDYGDRAWHLGTKDLYADIHSGKYAATWETAGVGTRTILVSQPIYVDVPQHYDLSVWIYRDEVYGKLAKEGEGVNIWVNNRPDTVNATKLGFVSSIFSLPPVEEAAGYYKYEYNIPIAGNVYIIFEGISKNAYDIHIDDIEVTLAPLCRKVSNVALSTITTNSAKVVWNKGLNEDKWNVHYTLVCGQNEVSETIVVEGTPELELKDLIPASQYSLDMRISANCGAGDVAEPVFFSQKFQTECDAMGAFPYMQTFDDEVFPPHCWRQYQSQAYGNPNDQFATDWGNDAWIRNSDKIWNPEFIKSGAASAQLQTSSAGIRSALITPQFTFESGKEYVVSFWMYRISKANESTPTVENEGLNILLNDQPNVVDAHKLGYVNVGSQFAPRVETDGYYQYEFTFTASGNKYLIFEGQHQGTMAIYIDNVVVREKTNCGFFNVKIDSIKTEVARVTSLDPSVNQWQVSVGAPSFNPNTGTIFNATGSTTTITGLTPQTDYELYARQQCADGSYGPWSEFVYQFSTQCLPTVVDYNNTFIDGFENNVADEALYGCYQQILASEGRHFSTVVSTRNDEGAVVMTPYEGAMFAAVPYSSSGTWLFRPFELKANANYEVSLMARQDCDFGMNLNIAYFREPDLSTIIDTMTSAELVSSWKEYKGWINAPADGTYYIGVNVDTWGVSVRQNNSVIDNFTVRQIECAPPVQIKLSKVTAQSAQFDFHSIADVWEVKISKVNFDPQYAEADVVNDTIRGNHYEVSGLTTNTEYFYSFRSLCTEPSEWSHVQSFRTICSTFELPYYEDFEDPEFNNILCWNSYLNNQYTSKSEVSATETYKGGVAFKMYESMTILPKFNVTTLANYLVRGYAHASDDNAHISIGVVGDINNPAETFEPVADVVVRKEYEWQEFVAYLSDLSKPDYAEFVNSQYIAFVVSNGTEFYIDNLEVIEIPTCLSPTEVVVSDVTRNSCKISWYENGNAQQWQVRGYYKNELTIDTLVTSNPAIITSLNPASAYDLEIRAVCSDADQSWWSSAGSITTLCDAYSLPYDHNFDGLDAPKCWTQGLAYPNTQANYWVHKDGAYRYNQHYDEETESHPATSTSMLVSPEINLVGVTKATMSLDVLAFNTGNMRILVSDNGGASFDSIIANQKFIVNGTFSFTYDLTPYVGKVVYIGIEGKSSGRANSYLVIDNFSIEPIIACVRPYSLALDVAYDTSARFILTDTTSTNTRWQYAIGSVGFNPDTASVVDINTKTFTIPNLTPRTNYEVYVRTNCGNSSHSYWRGPVEIQTACPMDVDFPYYESFEGITSLNDNCFRIFRFNSSEDAWPRADINTKTYVSHGSQGLQLSSSESHCLYVALPLFARPLSELKISFDYRNEYDAGYPTIATPLEIGVMADLNVEASYSRLQLLPYTSIDGFESYVYSFADADAKIDLTDKYIVFKYNRSPETKNAVWAGIDNIMIVPTDYCYAVSDLHVTDFTESTISLAWTSSNTTLQHYEYQLLLNNSVVQEGTVATDAVQLTSLAAATNYQFRVRTQCSANKYSDWSSISVRTLAIAPAMPYSVDFETDEYLNWILANEGQTNYFVVGSDKLGVKSGSKALYITDDGSLNHYSIGATSSAYAYRILSFEPGQYRFSYSWKCNGEYTDAYSADYARVYLSPVTRDIVAGRRTSTFMDDTRGCIMLDGDKGLNVSSRWNDAVVDVVFTDSVQYNLVIEWYNNAMGGSQTPFAIDDIKVEKIACPMPQSIDVLYVEDTQACVQVNSVVNATAYRYRLSTSGSADDYISSGSSATSQFIVAGLAPDTQYHLFVSAQCDADATSDYQSVTFTTEHAAASVPYSTDFASAAENTNWFIVNGTQKNGFVIGADNQSLHVSSQPKATPASYDYDSRVESAVYAYRLIDFDKGQYTISYDWKSVGSRLDYGRIFLLPTSYDIEPGICIGDVNDITFNATLPAECIVLDQGVMANTPATTHTEVSFFITTPGRYRLVVQWYNKGTFTGTLPLSVDNILIDKASCADVADLAIASVDYQSVTATFRNFNESASVCALSTSADVNLAFAFDTVPADTVRFSNLAGSTTYYLFVKAQCQGNLYSEWQMTSFTTDCTPIRVTESQPYFEGFESLTDNIGLNECWSQIYKHDDKTFHVSSEVNMTYNQYAFDGTKYLTFERGNNDISLSRQFYLQEGVFYCISAWALTSPTDGSERSQTTIQLVNFTDAQTLASRQVTHDAYRQVRRIFVPQRTGVYTLGVALNVGLSVSYVNLDNISVEQLRFGAPDQLEVADITTTSARATWMGIADHYEVQLYNDATLVADTTTADLSLAFAHLSPATTYRVRVRGIVLSPAQQSDWVETLFTTECDVALPNFNQSFETTNLLSLPVCWDSESQSSLADYTKNWAVSAEAGNKSLSLNTSEVYGSAVVLSPMIAVQSDNILSYRYRNLTHDAILKVEIRGAATRQFSQVILEGGHSGWQQTTFDLQAYAGDTIQLHFSVDSRATAEGNIIAIDDLRVACYAGEVTHRVSLCQGKDYFGHGFSISSDQLFVGVNHFDMFVTSAQCDTIKHLELTVNPVAMSHTYDTICRGDIYMWGDIPCIETDAYEVWYHGASACGCDSVAYLHLEVLDLRENLYARICEGESYLFGGKEYTATGIYVDTIPNPGSCDSIKILTLVVAPTTYESHLTICDVEPLLWNDTLLTTSGRYVRTFPNVGGCDSVEVLNLTVLPSVVELHATICQGSSYLFGARELTAPGVYHDSLVNVLGCDSIVTLHLTVSEPSRGIFTDYACQGYEYVGYGFRIDASQLHADTILSRTVKNLAGCDSIIEVHLDYVPLSVIDTVVTISAGDVYEFGEQTLTKPGTYTGTFVTAQGCDSVVNLTLQVGTGIPTVEASQLIIAPNPVLVGEVAYIQFDSEFSTLNSLEVFDALGQRVATIVPTQHPIAINAVLPRGVYIIRLTTHDGTIHQGKLIVN